MPFYVYARDRPGVGAQLLELAEAHWAYMDRFAGRLILRGPTLSEDGTEHTGSVHVVDLADHADAERFATEEPYWLAGLYRQVTAARAVVLHHREPAGGSPSPGVPDALVTGEWPPAPRQQPDVTADSLVSFVAVLVDDDESHATGIVSVVRAHPRAALRIVQPFADRLAGAPVALTAQRWRPGGRP